MLVLFTTVSYVYIVPWIPLYSQTFHPLIYLSLKLWRTPYEKKWFFSSQFEKVIAVYKVRNENKITFHMLDKYFGIESDSWMTSGQYKPQIV